VSDRGTQFTGALWGRICQILRIKRRLLIAFSPETDGLIERANQVIKAFFREFVNHAQDDWLPWLSVAVSAICGRDSALTGLSSFFLSYGWHQGVFEDFMDELLLTDARDSPVVKADRILRKLKELREWARNGCSPGSTGKSGKPGLYPGPRVPGGRQSMAEPREHYYGPPVKEAGREVRQIYSYRSHWQSQLQARHTTWDP